MTRLWHRLSCYLGFHDKVVELKTVRVPFRRKVAMIEAKKCSRCDVVFEAKPLGWIRPRKGKGGR